MRKNFLHEEWVVQPNICHRVITLWQYHVECIKVLLVPYSLYLVPFRKVFTSGASISPEASTVFKVKSVWSAVTCITDFRFISFTDIQKIYITVIVRSSELGLYKA